MTKKKYRQQSDSTSTLSSSDPASECASSSVPVSHSDDEGNVIIDINSTVTPAQIYEPIPEVVESSSLSPPLSSSVQGPDPVAESQESSEIDLVPAPVPVQVPVLSVVLEPTPVPVQSQLQTLEQDADADANQGSEPLSVLVLDSNPTSTSTSTPSSTSKWIQFKSWFSKCCRACCSCCCCCHRRRSRDDTPT